MMEKIYNEEYVINVLTEHAGLIMKYGRLFSNANATNNIYSEQKLSTRRFNHNQSKFLRTKIT